MNLDTLVRPPAYEMAEAGIALNLAVFHLAGSAAAICLRNKQKQLPEVYFEIILHCRNAEFTASTAGKERRRLARLEGGRLIQIALFP